MAYGQRQPYRRPTVLATLETRGAKGMHTRPCGTHIIPGHRSVLDWASTDPELTGEIAGRCKVGNLFGQVRLPYQTNQIIGSNVRFGTEMPMDIFPRSFAGQSIRPTQSQEDRASSRRKAQAGITTSGTRRGTPAAGKPL